MKEAEPLERGEFIVGAYSKDETGEDMFMVAQRGRLDVAADVFFANGFLQAVKYLVLGVHYDEKHLLDGQTPSGERGEW